MAELLGFRPGFQQTKKHKKKCTKKWHIPQNLNRRQEVIRTRVIIQIFFLTHSFLISKHSTKICNKFQQELIIQHIIQDCPDSQSIRNTRSIPAD